MKQVCFLIVSCVAAISSAVFAADFGPSTPDARPVSFLSSTSAVVNWETEDPCETRIQIREGTFVAGTPGYEKVWDKAKVVDGPKEKTRAHSMMLTGLKPATRYFYRVYDPAYRPKNEQAEKNERIWSYDPPWRREYAFATRAKPGEKAIVRIPMKVLIIPNVIDLSTVKSESSKPERMSEEELSEYKREFLQSTLFYWVNSGMRYWLEVHFFVEPEWQRVGEERDDLDEFYKGWPGLRDGLRVFDPLDISYHAAKWPLKDDKIYSGQTVVRCIRRWDENKKQWVYQGSGGGTFGIDWMQWGDKTQCPAPGRSTYLGGSDIAWLNTHEYHHQKESQYGFSGLSTENDRVVFCHFAPKYKSPMGRNWRWDTAFAHGEHYDGIAWELRMLTDVQYLRNMFGHIYVTKDSDGDGVPDDDFSLPLDEKRFGSDPEKASTDGTGMTDLEKIMSAKWVPTMLTSMRSKVYNPGYPPMWDMASKQHPGGASAGKGYAWPKAKAEDSDGDGIVDKEDTYPIYPWQPQTRRATITVDGDTEEWSGLPVIGAFNTKDLEFTVKTAYDMDNVYYMMRIVGETRGITLDIDGDDDGWYVGNDNLHMVIEPDDDGKLKVGRAITHLCGSREWPNFDDGNPYNRTRKIKVKKDGKEVEEDEKWSFDQDKRFGTEKDISFESVVENGARVIEIAIPNGKGKFPVQVGPGHVFSHAIYVGIPEKGAVPVYEAYTLFHIECQ
jgi:hypothetical protein